MNFRMGIIKVEIKIPELVQALESFKNDRMGALEIRSREIRTGVGEFFNSLLQTEIDLFLGHADQADYKRNGFREREYSLKGFGCLRIRITRDRKQAFKSSVLPPREQIDPRLKEDIAVLHLAGLSNRLMAMVSKRVLGVRVSPKTVTNSLEIIEDKALKWLERPIEKKYWALFVDGSNFRVQRRGSTEKEPSLVVLGIDSDNRMSILSIEPGQKDDASCWREVFKDLIKRGLDPKQVQIGIMDRLPGLEKAFRESFGNAITARCWVHSIKNAMAKVPVRLREAFSKLAHKIVYADSEASARAAYAILKLEMGRDAERAVRVIGKDLDSLVAHYKFEKRFWTTLRTTNPI